MCRMGLLQACLWLLFTSTLAISQDEHREDVVGKEECLQSADAVLKLPQSSKLTDQVHDDVAVLVDCTLLDGNTYKHPIYHGDMLQVREEAHANVLMALAHALSLYDDLRPHLLLPDVDKFRGRLVWDLRAEAAACGQPYAQALTSVAATFGMARPEQPGHEFTFASASHDAHSPQSSAAATGDAAAATYLHFAAVGNDAYAQAVLGQRHRRGVYAPKSCEVALLYLQPAAAAAADAAASASGLPVVEAHSLAQDQFAASGVPHKDILPFLHTMAEQGDTARALLLARMYKDGSDGIEQDEAAALRSYIKLAEGGHKPSMAKAGHMLMRAAAASSDDTARTANAIAAMRWFKAAQTPEGKRWTSAVIGIAALLVHGNATRVDYAAAHELLSSVVDSGGNDGEEVGEAQYLLGVMWLHGWGVPERSTLQAHRLFSAAAEADHPLAMYQAAVMRATGEHMPVDCAYATSTLARLARRPFLPHMARAHAEVEMKNYQRALWHYMVASEAGLHLASLNGLWLITHGYILPPKGAGPEWSHALAAAAVRLAEDASRSERDVHRAEAFLALGDAHYYGLGVPEDTARAAEFYAKGLPAGRTILFDAVARKQNAFAAGFAYQFGRGVPQDLYLARRYYNEMLTNGPVTDSQWACWSARAFLSAHRAWQRYFEKRPLLVWPLERVARFVVDVASHLLRCLHDPIYQHLYGLDIRWSTIPQRQPDSWAAAGMLVVHDAKVFVGVCLLAALLRRLLRSRIDRRHTELQASAESAAAASSSGAQDASGSRDDAAASSSAAASAGPSFPRTSDGRIREPNDANGASVSGGT